MLTPTFSIGIVSHAAALFKYRLFLCVCTDKVREADEVREANEVREASGKMFFLGTTTDITM